MENVCMNYIIIYVTTILLKLNKKPARIFFGALIGALYAVMCVIKTFEVYNSILIKILFSVIIVYVSTNAKNFKSLIKAVLVFYLVSFTFGGIALALLYFIKPENILMKNGLYIGMYPIKIVLLGGILGYILISIVYSIIKSRFSKKKRVCSLTVSIDGESRAVNALIDSGNFLKEPITGIPVVVVETEYLYGVIPKEILENVNNIITGNIDFLHKNDNSEFLRKSTVECNNKKKESWINCGEFVDGNRNFKNGSGFVSDRIAEENNQMNKFLNKVRLIPFNSLGKENGLLLGIKADFIKISDNEDMEDKKINNVIIGLYDKKLSKERCI